MSKYTPIAVMPKYLQRFACVGPDCPETCCSGWKVTIDKSTYKTYRAICIAPLESLVATSLERSSSQHTADWGTLRMRDNGDCNFLDDQRLCTIQTHLGERALSDTCRHYPRGFQRVEQQLRVFATLSCPEAARLALTAPDAMELVDTELTQFHNASELPATTNWSAGTGEPSLSFLAGQVLQDALLALLDRPGIDAFDALALGLMLVRRVNAYTESIASRLTAPESRDDVVLGLQEIFAAFTNEAHLQALLEQIRQLDTRMAFELRVMREISLMVQRRKLTASARAVVEDAIAGLGLANTSDDDALIAYSTQREHAWPAWERAHPHLLRNYLINSIQRGLPGRHLGQAKALEDAYLDLVIRAALLRFWMVGQMAHHGSDFTTDHAVRTVYALARSIEHDNRFMPGVIEQMDKAGIRGLATAMVLLR
jgi:lysine-N-methylase